MHKMVTFRFWYFGELFIFLHLLGFLHCSWWWAAFFYFIDLCEGLSYYSFVDKTNASQKVFSTKKDE